jgi:predicted nucleotidyltransferase
MKPDGSDIPQQLERIKCGGWVSLTSFACQIQLFEIGAEVVYSGRVGQAGYAGCPETKMSTASIEQSTVLAAAKLLRSMGAKQVFIFGSATKEGLRPHSDVDIAVTGLPSQVYFSAVSRASELFRRPVDLVDLDDSTPLVRYLLDSGELVRVE